MIDVKWEDGDQEALPKNNLGLTVQPKQFVSVYLGNTYECVKYSDKGCHCRLVKKAGKDESAPEKISEQSKESAPEKISEQKETPATKVSAKEIATKADAETIGNTNISVV